MVVYGNQLISFDWVISSWSIVKVPYIQISKCIMYLCKADSSRKTRGSGLLFVFQKKLDWNLWIFYSFGRTTSKTKPQQKETKDDNNKQVVFQFQWLWTYKTFFNRRPCKLHLKNEIKLVVVSSSSLEGSLYH